MEHIAVGVLEQIIVRQNTKGYVYLKEAVKIAVKDQSKLEHLGREIYGPIARKHNITANGVQQAICGTIGHTWENAELDVLQRYFGDRVLNPLWKPANREFLCILLEKVHAIAADFS